MTIQILGKGERRAVVYPLLHIMNHFSGSLLITDDGMYGRIVTNNEGFIGNVRLHVSSRTSHAALKSDGIYMYVYDTVIRDIGSNHEDADVSIQVCRTGVDEGEKVEGAYEVFTDFERPKVKKPYIPLTLSLFREFRDFEISGRLGAFRSTTAIRDICPIFAEVFGVSSKDIKNLLKKGGALT